MLSQIRFTLIQTTHPGNIGGVARSMKCMGLTDLSLVSPKFFPHADATSRASGADDILQQATVTADLGESIADCVFVVGTTSRAREIAWPVVEPRVAASRIAEEARKGRVAVLFGRESSGLTNKEVDTCNLLIRIPTCTDYSSLNLASAAQIMAYEVYLALQEESEAGEPVAPLANSAAMAMFYEHLRQTLIDLEFTKTASTDKLLRKLARLFNRAQPTEEEISIMRGILTSAQERTGVKGR